MSGDSERGGHPPASPETGAGVRSASPAKRSRADMEGEEKAPAGQGVADSFGKETVNGSTDIDEPMEGMTPRQAGDADTQTTMNDGATQTSAQQSMETSNTPATSLQDEEPPPYSKEPPMQHSGKMEIPSLDEQERIVRQLIMEPMDVGQLGYAVSTKWLNRVLSRTTEGLRSSAYPKEAREGEIGRIDNSDLVVDGRFPEKPLRDANKKEFVPFKPGMSMDEDYVILPSQAWGQIVGWYGTVSGQKQIVRYARDTSPPGAATPHIMYDLNPPVFTIRKVPQAAQEKAQPKKATSTERLKEKVKQREQQDRGQMSPDDAFKLVAARSEKFQKFLARAKEAADIPFSTKVKIWRVGKPSETSTKNDTPGPLSPPASRSTSPNAEQMPKLVIDAATFNKMEDCELIEAGDETNNEKYNGSSTLEMFELFEDATLVLEEQLGGPGGGEYASDKKPKHTIRIGVPGKSAGSKAPSAAPSRGASPAPGGMTTRGRTRRDGRTRGTVGLSNLGNTCYMNSALQCIRSVEELAVYFLSEQYKKEINSDNPLGHGGVMAKQYAQLLRSIYSETATGSFSPSNFKKTLGSRQPMFSGYGQQDSQEFLSFLVDALHEDLNRIHKKPYNENPDSDDNTVHDPQAIIELGETYRANHRARNESIAMDLFNGFYKNTMECPDCNKISITFDPFSLVTVQLPIESTFTHTYTFVPLSGKAVNHDIDFDKNASIKTLKEYIASKHPGVEANRLWMAEVYNHKFYKVFDDSSTVQDANIGSNDYIFIYELPAVPSNAPLPDKKGRYSSMLYSSSTKSEEAPEMDDPKADQFSVPVFSRQKNRHGNGWEWILHPVYVVLTREEAKNYDVVMKKTLIATSRLSSRPVLTEFEDLKDLNEESGDEKTENGDGSGDDKEVSDRSASEDGYVQISKHADDTTPQTNGEQSDTDADMESEDRPVPKGFMDPSYALSPVLRNQLFTLKYAKSNEGMHCTGMSSILDRSIVTMAERVKKPARRGSTDSSSSGESSTTNAGSGTDANGEAEVEETDNEFEDKPDIVIGEQTEDAMSLGTPVDQGEESDTLPDIDIGSFQKPGSQRGQKQFRGKNKGRKGKQRGYGKKDRGKQKGQQNGNGRFTVGGKSLAKQEDDEDNPFYIKLGEAIIVDWYPEALTQVFAGNANDETDKRGHFVNTPDGKNLPIFDDDNIKAKRAKRTQRKKQGVSLDECFAETGKREVLSEDNAWYCGRCKELRRATKTLEIWTIPDILVVHLKRFGGNRSFRDKVDVLVDYPIEGLDMTERVGLKEDGKEYIYDLFAVDNHFGGLGGGHYTAFAKNFYDGQWYDYNDASCSKLGDRTLQNNAAAYLLFYRRRSSEPLGPPALQALVNDYRNPTGATTDAATAEDAEESDSGEGQLGGRDGSARSSGGYRIGAGAVKAASGGTLLGGAGSSLRMRETTETSDDEKVFYGPERPPQFGNQGGDWGWNDLDAGGDDADAAGSDADSMTVGRGNGDEDGDALMEGAGDAWNDIEFTDDHTMYSGGRDEGFDEHGTLYLEDAGAMGGDAASDSTTEFPN